MLIPQNLQSVISRGRDDVYLFARELLGVELHPGQVKFSNSKAKVNVLVPSNRWGKSTMLAIKHIHKAFYKVGVPMGNMKAWLGAEYLTGALAPHSQQAEVITTLIRQILTSSYPMRVNGRMTTNKCLIEWAMTGITESYPMQIKYWNHSTTLVRSTGEDKGKSIAAKAFGYIGFDEACKDLHLEEEYSGLLIPRLADFSGQLDLVGTPDATSPSNIFYQELFWKGGGDGNVKDDMFYSQEGSAYDNPHLPPEYFEETKQLLRGRPELDQVLYGKFVSVGNKVFDNRKVLDASVEMEEYTPFEKGHRYIIAIDTAIGEDELVITVLDWTERPFKVVRTSGMKGNTQSPVLHNQNIMDIFYHYNEEQTCSLILEVFNGEAMHYYYQLPADIRAKTRCFGSGRVVGAPSRRVGQVDRKEDILLAGRKLLDSNGVVFSNKLRRLVQQLANYTQNDEKIKTDWVISFCLACWYATDGQPKITTLKPSYIVW
jgi:hypothetical protein